MAVAKSSRTEQMRKNKHKIRQDTYLPTTSRPFQHPNFFSLVRNALDCQPVTAFADTRHRQRLRVDTECGSLSPPSPTSESGFIPLESEGDESDEDLGSRLGLTAISHAGTATWTATGTVRGSSGLVDYDDASAPEHCASRPALGEPAQRLSRGVLAMATCMFDQAAATSEPAAAAGPDDMRGVAIFLL